MQIVLDYISGKIESGEFKEAWYSNPEIGKWLDSLIDLKNPLPEAWDSAPYSYVRHAVHKHYGGSALKFIEASDSFDGVNARKPKWLEILWHFRAIAAIIVIAYPDIVPTSYYEEEAQYYQNAVGESIGGSEVEKYIDSILDAFPNTMAKTKRIKAAKTSLRNHFPVAGGKYPRWCQEPEWPMGRVPPLYLHFRALSVLPRMTFSERSAE